VICHFIAISAVLLLLANPVQSSITCQNPSSYYGQLLGHHFAKKCDDGRDGQCVGAVMKLCGKLGQGNTGTWRKGQRVLDLCHSLPVNSAVATFSSQRFEGHAAVFLSCQAGGILVSGEICFFLMLYILCPVACVSIY